MERPWNWREALRNAEQMALSYLSPRFASHTDPARKWAKDRCQELAAGDLDAVLKAINFHISRPGEIGKKVAMEYGYFDTKCRAPS